MVATIDSLRKELDSLDLELLNVLEKRIELSFRIQQLKVSQGLPQTDSSREQKIIETLSQHSSLQEESIQEIFQSIIRISKKEFLVQDSLEEH